MSAVTPDPRARLSGVFLRALSYACPLQVVLVCGWLAVPHPQAAQPLALALITIAGAPLYLPLLVLARRPGFSRRALLTASLIGVGQMSAMTWAGGGLASGFELQVLWFVPVLVSLLPVSDILLVLATALGGWEAANVLGAGSAPVAASAHWGFAIVAATTLLVNAAGVGYVFGQLRAVSDRFRRRSVRDSLTGLGNRAQLAEHEHEACGEGRTGAAFIIDIDDFKLVNDAFGHHAGDELLRGVADRLRAHARSGDLLARAGGDEFALIAREVAGPSQATALADRLLGTCQDPFALGEFRAHVSVTVGVALLADAATVDEALRDADLALYAAKSQQRGSARLFKAPMRARAAARVSIEQRLRTALSGDELRLVYQPVVRLCDGTVEGMEALLRWRSPELGDVGPDQFIHVAERTGLIIPIGRFALARAVEQLACWRADGHDIRVGVNLSAAQLADEQLPGLLADLLACHDIPPGRVFLELTETALMERSSHQPLEMLDRLYGAGAQIALDDFGTGYSSLSRLSCLKLGCIKIDLSFVAQMLDDPTAERIVGAVVGMGQWMGVDIVAEGVETEAQLTKLVEMGCSHAQGYLFSAAVEADAAGRTLSQQATYLTN